MPTLATSTVMAATQANHPVSSVGRSAPSGLCWPALSGKPCPHGPACKVLHDQIVELVVRDLPTASPIVDGAAATAPADNGVTARIPDGILRNIRIELRKTRLCLEFQDGFKCHHGSKCFFVHITGPDARRVLAIVNSTKACPYEKHLQFCPQKACPFRHIVTDKVPRLSLKVMLGQDAAPSYLKDPVQVAVTYDERDPVSLESDLIEFEDSIIGTMSNGDGMSEEL